MNRQLRMNFYRTISQPSQQSQQSQQSQPSQPTFNKSIHKSTHNSTTNTFVLHSMFNIGNKSCGCG